ncbi:MAG TPA: universal stress protein [Vicinamibacterales bacterium]|nr:universal stress protein [Vicinamibacterales bacterium]
MFALSRILVPTRHGEPSKAAIRYGIAFARQFNAQLFLVHVLSPKEFDIAIEGERAVEIVLPESVPDAAPDSPADVARHAAHEDLSRLLDPEDERATRAQYLLRAARSGPGHEIVECAKTLGVELIVMGKHRLGFVEHLLAGSVTENVVRHAPCPVLIVQHPEHEFVVPEPGR